MEDNNSKNGPQKLMQLAKNGDVEAFGHLYELYFAPVFRYIYFRVKNKSETEDLVQDVFLKVYKSISVFQEKDKSPLAYFFTVARNTIIDYWRKKRNVSSLEKIANKISVDEKTPQELIERNEATATIYQAIEKLTEEQQEVVILKFIGELSNQEIANLLGKTEEAVRQLQCRALKALRKHLKDFKIYEQQQK